MNDSPLLSREKALGGSLYLDKLTTLLQDVGGLVGALGLSSPCGPLFSREEALGGGLYLDKLTTFLYDTGDLVGALGLSSPCGRNHNL